MTAGQIYRNFLTPQNLQEHMLRVAALCQIIIQSWRGPALDSSSIVQASLLHDLAKPLTFDPDKQAQFGMTSTEIADLKCLQTKIKQKFGTQEHQAITAIVQTLGLSTTTVHVIDNLEWYLIPQLLDKQDIEPLITIYSDMRIGPKGILSLKQRLIDLEFRTQTNILAEFIKIGQNLETFIQNHVNIPVNSITNQDLKSRFHTLLQLEI